MVRKFVSFLLVVLLVFSLPLISFAHSGNTDSKGGHHDNISGGYHYHHGYPAHQHENGVCPYSSIDRPSVSSSNGDLNWLFLAIPAGIIAVVLFVRRCKFDMLKGHCDTITGVSVVVISLSGVVLFLSFLLFIISSLEDLLVVAGVSAALLIFSIITFRAAIKYEKEQARKRLPNFKMFYAPQGKCYHSTANCIALKKAKQVECGDRETHYHPLLSKTPCPKCCIVKNEKVFPKGGNVEIISSHTNRIEDGIEMISVNSSNIKSIGHANDTLFVLFHDGSLYQYDSVPISVYAYFSISHSPGKYFNERIRDRYPCHLIPEHLVHRCQSGERSIFYLV